MNEFDPKAEECGSKRNINISEKTFISSCDCVFQSIADYLTGL